MKSEVRTLDDPGVTLDLGWGEWRFSGRRLVAECCIHGQSLMGDCGACDQEAYIALGPDEGAAGWEDMDHHYCVCGERPECGERPRFFLYRWLTGTPKR